MFRFPLLESKNSLLVEIIQDRIKDHVLAFPAEYYAELCVDACI
jgi:hypothetical protein